MSDLDRMEAEWLAHQERANALGYAWMIVLCAFFVGLDLLAFWALVQLFK